MDGVSTDRPPGLRLDCEEVAHAGPNVPVTFQNTNRAAIVTVSTKEEPSESAPSPMTWIRGVRGPEWPNTRGGPRTTARGAATTGRRGGPVGSAETAAVSVASRFW